MAEKSEKMRTVENAISQIDKQFGKGSVMKMSDKAIVKVQSIPTGSISLDAALGVGGVPKGRIIEIFGPEASGKTTLALHIVAEAQKQGGLAAFIDAEHALDGNYVKKLGIEANNLLISQPDTGEQALEIAETLIRSGAIDVIVVDSVAALVPKSEIEGEMGDPQMGMQARLMSQALRKLTGVVNKSNTCLIFINQLREKLGVLFGSPETTTGGRALKFYSTVRIDVRKTSPIKDGENVIGNRVRVKVVKNKVAPPFKETELDMIYGKGISKEGDLLDIAVEKNIIAKSGAWFSYKEEKIGQGRENSIDYLVKNPNMMAEIEQRVRMELGLIEGEKMIIEPKEEGEMEKEKEKEKKKAKK
jgi:recombination protein RecA